ncbi:MAG: MFS transporter [Pseudomonadota bacterium]
MFAFLRNNAPWLTVGAVLTLGSSFGQTFFISLFAAEIQGQFGLSHGQWGGIYATATLTSAAVMIWAGMLTDQFRVRVLAPAIWSVFGAACLWMAFAQHAWMLLPIVFLLRFAGQGMSSHIAVVAMSRWFVASRGKALSIAALGFAFGEATLPIIVVSAFAIFHWQTLWIFAALILACLVPVVWILLGQERTPQTLAQENASTGMEDRHWTRKDVRKHWMFWMMLPPLMGPPAFNTAFFFHQVHYATTTGLTHIQVVQFFPIYTAIGIGSMLLFGAALDRLGTRRLLPFHQIPIALAFLCFALASDSIGVGVGFVLLGITAGATATLPNAFWAEFFGTRNLGSIKSLATAIMVLGSALGPGITGLFLDFGVSLASQYTWISGYFCITTAILIIGFSKTPTLTRAA